MKALYGGGKDMDVEEVRNYALSLPGVTEDQPFGDDIITYRVEGKIFLCLWLGGGRYDMNGGVARFACKLTPERNEELRDKYDTILPAYHWNKKHWSDIYFDNLETATVEAIIRESHTLIISKLPKKLRGRYQ